MITQDQAAHLEILVALQGSTETWVPRQKIIDAFRDTVEEDSHLVEYVRTIMKDLTKLGLVETRRRKPEYRLTRRGRRRYREFISRYVRSLRSKAL